MVPSSTSTSYTRESIDRAGWSEWARSSTRRVSTFQAYTSHRSGIDQTLTFDRMAPFWNVATHGHRITAPEVSQ